MGLPRYFNRNIFRNVKAMDDYILEIDMETDTVIYLDFKSRLRSVRYTLLQDINVFRSVHTDGDIIAFGIDPKNLVTITADDFIDLIMIDRTR